jgi:hypothetical protein
VIDGYFKKIIGKKKYLEKPNTTESLAMVLVY